MKDITNDLIELYSSKQILNRVLELGKEISEKYDNNMSLTQFGIQWKVGVERFKVYLHT